MFLLTSYLGTKWSNQIKELKNLEIFIIFLANNELHYNVLKAHIGMNITHTFNTCASHKVMKVNYYTFRMFNSMFPCLIYSMHGDWGNDLLKLFFCMRASNHGQQSFLNSLVCAFTVQFNNKLIKFARACFLLLLWLVNEL